MSVRSERSRLRDLKAVAAPRTRRRPYRPTLVVADAVAITAAFVVARAYFHGNGSFGDSAEWIVFLASLPLWILVLKLHSLYDRDQERLEHSTVDDLPSVFHVITVGTWLFVAGSWAAGVDLDVARWVTFWACAVALVALGRAGTRVLLRSQGAFAQRAVIVGAGDVGQLIGRKLLQHPEYGVELVGFVDREPKELRQELAHLPMLGRPEQLRQLVDRVGVERVIIAFSVDRHEELIPLIRTLHSRKVHVDIVPRLFEAVGPSFDVRTIEGLPLVGIPPARLSGPALAVKRMVDVAVAGIALVVSAPLFAVVALLIKRDSRGPVLFRQPRLGKGMREFTMLKFRTMRLDTDHGAHRDYIRQIMDPNAAPEPNRLYKLDREDVVTRVGAWLRRTSLDELPQLINVIKGDMSLVGPRPCIDYETELFEPHHFERFDMPAGCTGLWQVTARAHTTFGEALDLDVAYVRSWSLGLDARLLLRTPMLLLRHTGTT